jgi:hypothetical protein
MDHRAQFPTMSALDGDDTEVVVRTRDSAHGGEGGRILMCPRLPPGKLLTGAA